MEKKTTKFKPGQSGNPAGRAPGKPNKLTIEARKLLEDNAGAVLQKAIDCALAGDSTAQRLVLGFALPKRVRPALILPTLNTPSAIQSALSIIADSAASGDIESDEVRSIAAVVEAAGRQIDQNKLWDQVFAIILEEIGKESMPVVHKIIGRLDAINLNALPPVNSLQFTGNNHD